MVTKAAHFRKPFCKFCAMQKERSMYLFDLDGTLIDSNGIWSDVDHTFLARRGYPYTSEYYEGVAHTILPKAAVFTKEYCHLEESCEEIIAEWMDLARDSYAHVALKPYVRELLDTLRARGERMAIFTSSVPVHCETALRTHALTDYFERIVFAHDLGVDKSEPDAFRRVCELLGVAPQECILLDDSVKSCRSARAAGLYVIGVYDPFFESTKAEMPAACDRFVLDLGELL
jgi:HAD superfamily hydrolase (TIGR01509 family)